MARSGPGLRPLESGFPLEDGIAHATLMGMSRCESVVMACLSATTACAAHPGLPGAGDGEPEVGRVASESPGKTPALCPAFAVSPPQDLCTGAAADRFHLMVIEKTYVCGELLQTTSNLLQLWRDPWTGMPYDSIPCGGPRPGVATKLDAAWGVFPQLAFADASGFAEDRSRSATTVDWEFVDRAPDHTLPSLVWALRITLRLEQDRASKNGFGGLEWQARADVSRYDRVRIRYRTSEPSATWQMKLGSGGTPAVEHAVALPGVTTWTDRTFSIAGDFAGTDASHLDHLVFAASLADAGPNPTLWIDQVSFIASPARLADCEVTCPSPLPTYPDLACYEPQTGAADIANALSFLSTAPEAGLLDDQTARSEATRLLASLESLPGARPGARADGQAWAGGGWFQDSHSPVSLMPSPRHRTATVAAQAQLFAALMVLETTWPALATRAAALRKAMDWSVLYDDRSGCSGRLRSSIDRCTGLPSDEREVDRFGTDQLLAAFLAEATRATPPCFWTTLLAREGCHQGGPADAPWYQTGDRDTSPPIPASDGGGAAPQLAALLYLQSEQIPMGPLSLGASAEHRLRAQYRFASTNNLALAGWSQASDPEACTVPARGGFAPERVTPYPSAMAASDGFPETYHTLRAFHLLGADAGLATGGEMLSLGLRDSFDQGNAHPGDAHRYLHAGWSELGLLNACRHELVRRRFRAHPVARAGYARLQSAPPPCP